MINNTNIVRFYGNMEWFDVDDDVNDVVFPSAFDKAKCLWNEDPVNNSDEILKLIEPFVRAWFVPAGLVDSEDIFPNQSDVDAIKIRVVGIDFSTTPFPLCKAEAWFDVPVSVNFTTSDLEEWQANTGEYFYFAISFGWEIPSLSSGDPYKFTYCNHLGAECIAEVAS